MMIIFRIKGNFTKLIWFLTMLQAICLILDGVIQLITFGQFAGSFGLAITLKKMQLRANWLNKKRLDKGKK